MFFFSGGDHFSETLDYGKVKFIHIPQDLQDQRAIADREEDKIIQNAKIEENKLQQNFFTFPNQFRFPEDRPSRPNFGVFASSRPEFRSENVEIFSSPRPKFRPSEFRHHEFASPRPEFRPQVPKRSDFVSNFFSTPRKTPLHYYPRQ